ncbi:MAG: hypothetical protein ACOCTP_02900 [Roseicyclus sp.]
MSEQHDLWVAVLAAGLQDAAKGRDAAWIGSPDFRHVCTLAGLDPEAVADRFDPEQFRRTIRAA